MSKFILFLILLAIHLFYDFNQGDFVALNKGKRPFLLFVHALTWTLLLWIPGYFLGGFGYSHFFILFMSHALCDSWKCRQPHDDEHFYLIYIDQAIHLLSIIVVLI